MTWGRTFIVVCTTSAMFLLSATTVAQFVPSSNETPQIPSLSSIPEKMGAPLRSQGGNVGFMRDGHEADLDSEAAPTLNSRPGSPPELLSSPPLVPRR